MLCLSEAKGIALFIKHLVKITSGLYGLGGNSYLDEKPVLLTKSPHKLFSSVLDRLVLAIGVGAAEQTPPSVATLFSWP